MEHAILYALPVLVPLAAWFVITTLRRQAGMDKHVELPSTPILRTSRWGSATVNGVPGNNIFKIDEYDAGYLLRAMWIFGNGKLWLPKPLKVGDVEPGNFFRRKRRIIISGFDQVILVDRLVDFIQPNAAEQFDPLSSRPL
jgi:hypothetical protein